MAAAIAAAVLFGASAPAAKSLLADAGPFMLSALLYLGAGLGLTGLRLTLRGRRPEAALRREDVPLLAAIATAGGLVAPVLLLVGLHRVSAVSGSLLLNLESPLTVLLAVTFSGERLGSRAALGTIALILGAATLAIVPSATAVGDPMGMLAVVGACLAWAIDNNLTQRLSLRDPLALAQVKGLTGGGIALVLALAQSQPVPPAATVAQGLALGFVSYGLSVALAVYSMREIGVAREAALFATAPFMGVALSVVWLGEPFAARELGALALMVLGLGFLSTERHSHAHRHEALRHDHGHTHDEHHQHAHGPDASPDEPHAHTHTHAPLDHDHPHAEDAHHRHH